MMFGVGAASSAIDLLKSLTSTSGSKPAAQRNAFDAAGATSSPPSSEATAVGSPPQSGGLSPDTISALLDAQSSAASLSSTSDKARSKALKDLLSLLDGDGDGKVSKSEFENALGAGGTNTAKADDVFSKMDTDGDGSVSASEMSSALKGRHKPHTHKTGSDPTDPLLQTLDPTTDTTSTNSTGNVAAMSYDFMNRALQSQAQSFARAATPLVSISV